MPGPHRRGAGPGDTVPARSGRCGRTRLQRASERCEKPEVSWKKVDGSGPRRGEREVVSRPSPLPRSCLPPRPPVAVTRSTVVGSGARPRRLGQLLLAVLRHGSSGRPRRTGQGSGIASRTPVVNACPERVWSCGADASLLGCCEGAADRHSSSTGSCAVPQLSCDRGRCLLRVCRSWTGESVGLCVGRHGPGVAGRGSVCS